MSSSTPLTYASPLATSTMSLDGTTQLKTMITFTNPTRLTIEVQHFAISAYINNVMNYGGINNGLVRVSKDGGTTWTSIQLPDGLYTSTDMIAAGINDAISGWWNNPSVAGFTIRYNLATRLVYVYIKTSTLKPIYLPAQLAIDFSQSDIGALLGFTTTGNQTFNSDGTFYANTQARLNWIGDSILCWVEGFGPLGIYNGVSNNILFSMPLSASFQKGATEYIFPYALPMQIIQTASATTSIQRFRVYFTGNRKDANGNYIPVYAFDGSAMLVLNVKW